MRYEIEIKTKLKGSRAEYHVLKVFDYDVLNKGIPMAVHTSKDLKYLYKLVKERYQNATSY